MCGDYCWLLVLQDEYFEVDDSAIKHDGFFVNRGKLERMWVSDFVDHFPSLQFYDLLVFMLVKSTILLGSLLLEWLVIHCTIVFFYWWNCTLWLHKVTIPTLFLCFIFWTRDSFHSFIMEGCYLWTWYVLICRDYVMVCTSHCRYAIGVWSHMVVE